MFSVFFLNFGYSVPTTLRMDTAVIPEWTNPLLNLFAQFMLWKYSHDRQHIMVLLSDDTYP